MGLTWDSVFSEFNYSDFLGKHVTLIENIKGPRFRQSAGQKSGSELLTSLGFPFCPPRGLSSHQLYPQARGTPSTLPRWLGEIKFHSLESKTL